MSHLKLVASAASSDTTPYAEAFEQLDTGLCIIGSDGSVLANNQEFCRLLDLPSDWASPKAAKRAIPASEELVTGWLARIASEGGVDETVALSDNLTFHVAGKALPSGGVSLTLSETIDESLPLADIANQATAQQALQESEARLRAVIDNASEVLLLKGLDGRFQFVGKSFETVYGVPADEVIGKTSHDVVPKEFADFVTAQDRRVIETGEAIREEAIATHADGTVHTMLVSKFPVRDDAGNIVGVGSINTDITNQVADRRALRESEALFSTLVENLPISLSLKDDEGRFVYVNPGFETMFRHSKQDIIGHTPNFLGPDTAWNEVLQLDAEIRSGQRQVADYEQNFIRADGSDIRLHVIKFPVTDADGQHTGIGNISVDITEKHRAERLLHESEARFRTLLDHLPNAISLKDTEGKFLLANKACEQLFDLAVADMVGRTIWDVLPGQDWHDSDASDALLLRREKAVVDEEVSIDFPGLGRRILRRTKFPIFDSDGQPVGIGTISTDVTERLQAERLQRESEARFRALVENLPAGLTLKDYDQNVLFVNGRVAERFGIDAGEFVGKKFEEVVPDLHSTDFLHAQQATIDSGEAMEMEFRALFGDGSEHDLHTVFFPVNSGDGEHINVGIMSFDITERKRTEEMLVQAQKMEAVGQLTGGIAHDFNNLLSVIVGNLELVTDHLADQFQADAPVFDYVRSAFTAAERGASLIHHLLAFARKQVLRPEETDLERLIYETNELMSVSIGEKIVVELSADRNLWRCTVDRAQLQNAILNLAINARDAMSLGGRLTVNVENTHLDSNRAADLELEAGDYVCLSVCDTGPGIPHDVIEHVYEPFFTTKDVGEGSGLGLSMVYGFARQSGGSVDIETGIGEGTTVRLYFPAIVPDIPIEMGAEVQDERAEPVATILLVEDNAEFREITRKILESLNYHVVDFGNAEGALTVIGDIAQFDLLLSDIGLPGRMDGHDLAEYAASTQPGLKIVLMSAHTDKEIGGGIVDHNVSAFLRKPHRKAELARILRRVLDHDS